MSIRMRDAAPWIVEHDPLPVVSWDIDNEDGYDVASEYVETYWLAVLGPASILAVRRLSSWLDGRTSGLEVELGVLAQTLGLGSGTARHSPIVRTLDRLVTFGLAKIEWDALAVRRSIAPLPTRLARRLPACLVASHDDELRLWNALAAVRPATT